MRCLPSTFWFFNLAMLAGLSTGSAQPVVRPAPAATSQPIRVEIQIPPAQSRVIGDPTPLVWRFTNTATQTLAFMWEGCCRNNGKVEMRRQGPPPPATGVVPSHNGFGPGIYNPKCDHCKQTRKLGALTVESTPAGPSLAHQFARAVRLAPGATQEFSTLLTDWVKTEFTGDYKVRAQYLGVHPKQRPQMPRGAALWNGRTASTELDISLLSVADYLAERPARAAARQLSLALSGPARLVPFAPAQFKLKLSNTGRAALTLDWPACLDLWIVATNGTRVIPASEPQFGAAESLIIPPGSTFERELPLSHELVVGEPLGRYQIFVDLRETSGALRVPSNPLPLAWLLEAPAVTSLLRDAADRPLTGARNAPLKLLRVYLGDLGPALRAVDASVLSAPAAKLAADLRLAASLKPLAPRPGRVDLSLSVAPDGNISFHEAVVIAAFAGRNLPPAEQLRTVLSLRHHLGWDVGVGLQPAPNTSLRHMAAALAVIAPLRNELTSAPAAVVFNADSTAFSSVTFPGQTIPANLVLRVSRVGAAAQVTLARRLPDPQRPGVEPMFSEAEIGKLSFTAVASPAAFEAALADGQLASPRVLVLASGSLTWAQLTAPLAPILNRSLAFDLVVE